MFHVCSFYIKGLLELLISNYGEKGALGPMGERARNLGLGAGSTSLVGSATVGPQAGWGWGDPAEWGKDGRVRSSIQETPNLPPWG